MKFSRESGLFTLKTLTLAAVVVFTIIAIRAGIELKAAQEARDAASLSPPTPQTTLEIRVGGLSWNFSCEASDPRPVCYNIDLLLRGTNAHRDRDQNQPDCDSPTKIVARGLLHGKQIYWSGEVCPNERSSTSLLASLFAIAPSDLHDEIAAELYAADPPRGSSRGSSK